jgi:TonB family protein
VLAATLFLNVACSGDAQTPNSAHAKHPVLYAPPPKYPFAARARHLTGAGVFACNLRQDGTVASVDIVKSTGHDSLDDAAISALRRWKFKPGGAHVVRVPLAFTIHGVRRSGGPVSD